VALNLLGGYRNTMTMVLTGLDIEAKAEHATTMLFGLLGGPQAFEEVDVRLLRFDRPDAPSNEQATAHLRITVKDQDERKVGRAFSGVTFELALGGYPGFHTTTPPTAASAFGVYWPALVPRTWSPSRCTCPTARATTSRTPAPLRAPSRRARRPPRRAPDPSACPSPRPR
jgi:hypothetical protein